MIDPNEELDPTKRNPLDDRLGMGPVKVASPMGGPMIAPAMGHPMSPTGVSMYNQGDSVPATGTAPAVNPHVAEIQRLQGTGSGVSQVQAKHPFWGGVLRGLDVAASAIAPPIAAAIPGTTLHHDELIHQQEGLANQDVARDKEQAQTQEIQQRPQMQQAEMEHQEQIEAQKEAARQAQETQAQQERQSQLDETLQQQQDVADQREEAADANRQSSEEKADQRFAWQEKNADRRAAQGGNIGTWQLHDSGNGQVVEYNSKTGEVRPAPAGISPKLTADEQRRHDLAQNLNENLNQLEDIARRRPELFGPGAGRLTSARNWVGSSDPDIAALGALKEMVGQAMLGAHSMRSAQHIEAAANAILNGYKMEPDALINGAIPAARKSIGTFLNQKQGGVQPPTSGGAPAPSGPPAGAVGIAPGSDGKNHYHDAQGKDLGVAP